MGESILSASLRVRGVVQGVGFRPFVYQLALELELTGWVSNTSSGVRIEAEGPPRELQQFLSRLRKEAPPLSRIEELSCEYGEPRGFAGFEIRASMPQEGLFQRVSPDTATCEACRQEIFDPKDRRHRYAFTNCTNCGPRLTILRDIPYDRPNTTMAGFTLCAQCREEYEDPLNRRFHAQPNCCPRCGPQLDLTDRRGNTVAAADPLAAAAALLRDGKILALKGLGGFLLACDASREDVVQELRRRKRRPFKPFAVMMSNLEEVKKVCAVCPEEEAILLSARAPIVLLRIRDSSSVAPGVAPNLKDLGVLLPYSPLHHLLMKEVGMPLVMTSGNLSEEPIVKDHFEALEKLSPIADSFLWHNRDIQVRCDDSVVRVGDGQSRVIRRARGYAPDPVLLPFEMKQVLGCGADIKNSFCITRDRYAFLSPHVGDMENLETLRHFESLLGLYQKMFRLNPRILAHDLHPDYLSTRYALGRKEEKADLRLVPVQHHHAHVASCMAENGVAPPVLGVAFDGTGLGTDGTLWGGEFFVVNRFTDIRRAGHLECVPLPGGEASIRKPYRMAFSYLYTLLGEAALTGRRPAFLRDLSEMEEGLLVQQIRKGIHTPMTSGAGRLFDAVSALLGVRGKIDYEAQAAIELEMLCDGEAEPREAYPFRVQEKDGQWIVHLEALFSAILDDLEQGVSRGRMASRFHLTVAHMIAAVCDLLSRDTGLSRVVASGGVFQNRVISTFTRHLLEEKGFEWITHRDVPCNDACISLGQAVIAHFLTE